MPPVTPPETRSPEDAGLALYVHLPWCVQKCPYCDFNSHELKGDLPEAPYVDAVLQDLDAEAQLAAQSGWRRPFHSVFFGGGTPSLFSADAIGRMLERAAQRFGLRDDAEITLEANPGAIEHTSFSGLRDAGVNRLSLGAQSFDDDALKALGRVHRAHETTDAMAAARRAGFADVNLDIMYGLPNQSVAAAAQDLAAALALAPTHLSHYQLTLEPNTWFHHQPPQLPDDDTAWAMHQESLATLGAAGFAQYEISAYALPGREARHNLCYWQFGDYVGVGAGAHGKITYPDGRIERTARPRHPSAYVQGRPDDAGWRSPRPLEANDLAFEYPLNWLRLKNRPLSLTEFERATGSPGESLLPALRQAVDRNLMRQGDAHTYATTDLGWRFLNDLQALFLAPSSAKK